MPKWASRFVRRDSTPTSCVDCWAEAGCRLPDGSRVQAANQDAKNASCDVVWRRQSHRS